MSIESTEMVPYMVDYVCDTCGKAKMRPTGRIWDRDPPAHTHACAHCGAVKEFRVQFPTILHVPVGKTVEKYHPTFEV